MAGPGQRNLITDIDGLAVGNAEDSHALTGVTVLLPDRPMLVAADVRGGAPGTREISALAPTCLVDRVDAIVLSGGSVFGLDAAGAVALQLSVMGRGWPVGEFRAPIVPAAILQDLTNGGDKNWGEEPPYRRLARAAMAAASVDFALGNAGAGLGATAGPLKGGLGSASILFDDGLAVGALIAVNAVGSPLGGGSLLASPYALEGEFEALGGVGARSPEIHLGNAEIGANTTIGIIATNATLDKAQAQRVAIMAHDGLARAIRPIHTPFDGDTLFALSTGDRPLGGPAARALTQIGAVAADCVARAVGRAVFEADSLGAFPGYRDYRAGHEAGE